MATDSAKVTHKKPTARSRATNAAGALIGVDGRTGWARRYRDITELLVADMGGFDHVSQGELHLARRAATLATELERMDASFAEGGCAATADLDAYQRATNTLRRVLETLGLKRRILDVTPDLSQYLEARAS